MHITSWRRSVLAALLAAAHGAVLAADAPPYPELLRQAQADSPRLREQAALVGAAEADARQAQAWPNPVLAFSAENLGAPRLDGVDQRQDTYTLTQNLELGGKRPARAAAEAMKAAAVRASSRQAQLAFAGELALAYATAEAAQRRQQLAEADRARAAEDLRAAQALVDAGREAPLRLAQAKAGALATEAAMQGAHAERVDALARLSALAGVPQPYTGIQHPFLAQALAAQPAGTWQVDAAPSVASADAERAAAAAQVSAEQKRWLPDLGVSLGVRKYGWTSSTANTLGLTVSIPLFDRNQSGVDAAQQRANAAASRLEQARLEAQAQHSGAGAQLAAARQQLGAATQAEAAAAEAYRLARIGFEAGKTPLAELTLARRALSDAQGQTLTAQLACVRALATLSQAEGRNLFEAIGETR